MLVILQLIGPKQNGQLYIRIELFRRGDKNNPNGSDVELTFDVITQTWSGDYSGSGAYEIDGTANAMYNNPLATPVNSNGGTEENPFLLLLALIIPILGIIVMVATYNKKGKAKQPAEEPQPKEMDDLTENTEIDLSEEETVE